MQAIGDDNPYTDGPVSEHSDGYLVTVDLDQVAKPTWDGWTIKWVEVPNAVEHSILLYKDGDFFGSFTAFPGTQGII